MWIVYKKDDAERAGFKYSGTAPMACAIINETSGGKPKAVVSWHMREDSALLIANLANQKYLEAKAKFEKSVPAAIDNDAEE